ncbi:MAG: UDP-2,3-diacylglucosamine diphosphatase, partial [Ignavibacteriaceae bacterium]|nr:UDP-2,3-diacylglucosamine diphosphatase [Ignavibacteriaceae bacterium]
LTEKGIKVHYFIGNHDFFHKDFFEKEIGVHLYPDAESFILNGKKFFIAHGDGLVKNDLGYNILKKILRNRFIQWLYGLIHPDIGVAIASRTSASSRNYTAKKDYGEEDGLFETAKLFIDKGNDYVLFGHLHKRCFYNYKQGVYVNLGSWIDNPCYGKFTDKFEITDWK